MRYARFLQSALVSALFSSVLLLSSDAAWSRGSGGGHGGHVGGGHGFHGGRGHHFHRALLFVGPFTPFDFAPEPFSPGIPPGAFGCEDGLGDPAGCSIVPPGIGLLQAGPSLPEDPQAAMGEIDLTRAHWREPESGECPPDQKLLRLPGQRKWRCADPRLQRADALRIAP